MPAKKRSGRRNRPGPKPRNPEQVRSERLTITLTPPEREKLERIAATRGMNMGTLAYDLLSKALKRL